MKWLSAGLAFFNASTIFALVVGMMAHGLNRSVAIFCVLAGLVVAFLAYQATVHIPLRAPKPKPPPAPPPPETMSKRQQRREERTRKNQKIDSAAVALSIHLVLDPGCLLRALRFSFFLLAHLLGRE